MTERWAPVHRTYDWAQCRYCGRSGGDCERVECMLCSASQCKAKSTCALCLVGYLPGWSRKTESWQLGNQYRTCQYKGCDNEAVAVAPRVKAVCIDHAHRAKAQGTAKRTIAEVGQCVATRLEGQQRVANLRWQQDNWVLVS